MLENTHEFIIGVLVLVEKFNQSRIMECIIKARHLSAS